MVLGLLEKSTPYVPHQMSAFTYSSGMGRERTTLGWGRRFRDACKQKGVSLSQVAANLELSESTVRSWTNGVRDINLSDYFRLCDAAGLDPAVILFAEKVDNKFLAVGDAWAKTDDIGRAIIEGAAQAALTRQATRKTGTSE